MLRANLEPFPKSGQSHTSRSVALDPGLKCGTERNLATVQIMIIKLLMLACAGVFASSKEKGQSREAHRPHAGVKQVWQ